jgi:hypothetical protein
VENIYVRNIENLRTAFAGNTYGRSITDWVLNMADDNGAIAAINGDYYGVTSRGVVIRNGVLYNGAPDGEVCVLFYDGTMKIVEEADFDAQELMEAGAYQALELRPVPAVRRGSGPLELPKLHQQHESAHRYRLRRAGALPLRGGGRQAGGLFERHDAGPALGAL